MTIKEIVLRLQTPGHGSSYQDEKMLQDFIDNAVAKATEVLRGKLVTAQGEIAALTKINHKLSDQLNELRKSK
jgi:hypothetical protein